MTGTGYGHQLKQARERHGLTQQGLADKLVELAWMQSKQRVGVERQMVSKWERELKTPDRQYRKLLCSLYGMTEQQLGFSSTALLSPALFETSTVDGMFESPLDIVERLQFLSGSNVNDQTVTQLESVVDAVVEAYETQGPAALAARVVRQRQQVQQLLEGPQHPRQRDRLYLIAGKLSALLGYMAVNLGKFSTATAYNREAFQLGQIVDSSDLQAWVRGTQSFCAYYAGDFRAAVDLARDGQRYAKNGPQAVRLASNGEARALGKLGDVRGVDEAVQRAYRLAEHFEPVPGVSPCISFGLYSNARTASNAATAYVDLGLPERVREYADQVMPTFEASDSVWSQSLVRLDLAKSMVLSESPEPERAATLVVEALTISAERPITSVLKRSREFIHAASRWNDLPAVSEVAETLQIAERR